ncbi:MAG: histidine decarboxylase [Verrucomicrobiales bacterium]
MENPTDSPAPGLSPEDQHRLDDLFEKFEHLNPRSIGYPCNQTWDYSSLYRFLQFSANNIGDPFQDTLFKMNTHDFEREVVEEFARFTQADPDDHWGYVTAGGTEGNMYGLYLARELHPDGIVYFSEQSHYSVAKILRLQHTRNIMLRSLPSGEMDYDDLRESIRIRRDVPPIIFANIGTTMKGAIDNLDRIREIFEELAIQDHYIHADAALSGMILPFVNNPPPWNFSDGVDSLSISGHKLIGAPLPCGIAMARKCHVDRIARSVEYVGVNDTTIMGSRSAFSPLILWYALKKLHEEGLATIVRRSLELADYAIEKFATIGVEAWRNSDSITVVFPRPPISLTEKWVIAPQGDIAHIITLPHVTREVIDSFVHDYAEARASSQP